MELKKLFDELKETDEQIKETVNHAEIDDLFKRRWEIYDKIEALGYGIIHGEPINLTFTTRSRWASGQHKTLLVRIPKDLATATNIKSGDYLTVAIIDNHGQKNGDLG